MSYLSNKLKELRIANNISQYKLAEELDIKRSAYGNYETGLSYPEYDVLEKIADYYKVDIVDLLEFDERFENSLDIQKEAKKIESVISEYYYKNYRKIPSKQVVGKMLKVLNGGK